MTDAIYARKSTDQADRTEYAKSVTPGGTGRACWRPLLSIPIGGACEL